MNRNVSVIKLTMDLNPIHLDMTADWWHITTDRQIKNKI